MKDELVNDAAQGVVEDVPQDVAQDFGFGARAARLSLCGPRHATTAAATTTIVLVVARAIFMRWNPGAAKDGSVKVFIVARVIFERMKPKKGMLLRGDPDAGLTPVKV